MSEKTRRECSHLVLTIKTAERATQQAMTQLADLRLTDYSGFGALGSKDGQDAGEALAAAESALRNARRVVRLREMELEHSLVAAVDSTGEEQQR